MAQFKNNNLILTDDEAIQLGDAAETSIVYDNDTGLLSLGDIGTKITLSGTSSPCYVSFTADGDDVAVFDSSGNIMIGRTAGINFGTAGGTNTAIGDGAGATLGTTGLAADCIFIGSSAGGTFDGASGGGVALFIGSGAGASITTALYSTLIGYQAGQNAGQRSVALGYEAGQTATGTDLVAIGYRAGAQVAGNFCTAIGVQALYGNSANNSTAVGYKAGYACQGSDNLFLGYQAGDSATTGTNNILIGSGVDLASAMDSNKFRLGVGSALMFDGDTSAETLTINAQITIGAGTTPYSLPNSDSGVANDVLATNGSGVVSFTSLSSLVSVDKIIELNTSVEAIDTGTDGRIVLTADGSFVGQIDDSTILRIGYLAAGSVTGINNTVIGSNAGAALGSGSGNTIIGSEAAETAYVTDSNAVVIGFQAGENTTSSTAPILIGYQAGRSVTGASCVAIGGGACSAGTGAGAGTVAIGYGAGKNLTGGYNVLVGYNAGDTMTSGTYNIGIGNSPFAVTTGSHNVAIGSQALNALTSGANNVAIGANTLDQLTNGTYNIAIGEGAMGSVGNTATTSGNICIGIGAGNIIDSDYNVAIGSYSLQSESTVGNSVAVGAYAASKATGGSNVAVGYYALGFSTNHAAARDTIIGYEAGKASNAATDNTLIGYQAGDGITSGSYNVFIGANTGDALTTETGNVFIGHRAGYENIVGNYNVCIGNYAHASSTLASGNRLWIHSAAADTNYPLILGEFDTGDTPPRKLKIHGRVYFSDSTDSDSYYFPMVDGAAGQVLQTDGSGELTWQTAAFTTVSNLDIDTGTEDVDTFDPSADGAVVWHYFLGNGSAMRAGTVQAVWDDSAGTVEYTETVTLDLTGSTAAVTLAVDMSGAAGSVRLRATASSDNWVMRAKRIAI